MRHPFAATTFQTACAASAASASSGTEVSDRPTEEHASSLLDHRCGLADDVSGFSITSIVARCGAKAGPPRRRTDDAGKIAADYASGNVVSASRQEPRR
jgi:hypothetical protein